MLHLAVAECLIANPSLKPSEKEIYIKLIPYYKNAMRDMHLRAPGMTTINAVKLLNETEGYGYKIDFNPRGAGCGASMRSSCIGLRFSRPDQLKDLIAFSVESGRMTHHHPIGYLGATAAALLVSYAIQGLEIKVNIKAQNIQGLFNYLLTLNK